MNNQQTTSSLKIGTVQYMFQPIPGLVNCTGRDSAHELSVKPK